MNKFKNQLIIAAVFGGLMLTGTLMNTHRATAQVNPAALPVAVVSSGPLKVELALPVNIVNQHPLPVNVTGTPKVELTRNDESPARSPFLCRPVLVALHRLSWMPASG